MNLLLLEPGERELSRSDPRARHIEKVLRLGPGDTLKAGVAGGLMGEATIREITDLTVALDLDLHLEPPALAPVELLLGHPRPIVLKRLLRDLASAGPSAIHLVPTELGEKSYAESNIWENPRRYLLDGASQGGTTRLPVLVRHRTLPRAIDALSSGPGSRLVLHPGEGVALRSTAPGGWPVAVAVGSERGWTAAELATLAGAGFRAAHLGRRVLRTENAALIAVWSVITARDESESR